MLRSGAPSLLRKRRVKEECGDDSDYEVGNDGIELSQQATRNFNAKALMMGDITVHRAPVMRFLGVSRSSLIQPFRPPMPQGWQMPEKEIGLGSGMAGRKTLGMTRIRSTSNYNSKFKQVTFSGGPAGTPQFEEVEDELFQKYKLNPIVLYETPDGHRVVVEPIVGKYLREHQREGIQFLFECINSLRDYAGSGCILADDMGLGKTLQSITLLYTVLRQGLTKEEPIAKRVVVVTPTSLVRNWDNEIEKWLKGRVRCLALAESNKAEITKRLKQFVSTRSYDVLIISYDTFRLNVDLFKGKKACDLLICDEAHRLKNDQTKTSKALDTLETPRRVLLSGTPMQNDLEEFFAMVNFCNPKVLGTVSQFRKKYQNPILIGREPYATDEEVKKSEERSRELSEIVNMFILRRTNSLLSKHLPPKLTQVVCINPTEMQKRMYRHMSYARLQYMGSENKKKGISAQALTSINALKKLCNHPQLLFQKESKYAEGRKQQPAAFGLDTINQFFPDGFGESGGYGRRSMSASAMSQHSLNQSNCEWSGKFLVTLNLLRAMREETDDRMVIVSNYTQTLDLFSMMCKENKFPFVRLDGTCSAKRRQGMVDRLNNPQEDVFVFLLSSKAGGCGLNLIGANRLILFDPDWNPATDKQAAARVWRDGQKKRTYVYRFLATGTIEEKVFQRQLSKEGLQSVVADDQSLESMISQNDLKDLFTLREDTISDTHDKYKCDRCDKDVITPTAVAVKDATYLKQEEIKKSQEVEQKTPASTNHGNRSVSHLNNRSRLSIGRSRVKQTNRPTRPFNNVAATEKPTAEQVGFPNEGDLCEWSHHAGCDSCDDALLRKAGRGLISFVFGQAIDGEALALKAAQDARKAEEKAKAEQEKENKADDDEAMTDVDSVRVDKEKEKKKKKKKKKKKRKHHDGVDHDETEMEVSSPLQEISSNTVESAT